MTEPNKEVAVNQGRVELAIKNVDSLPFTYTRVYDRDSTPYHSWRVNPIRFGKRENEPRTDDEIVKEVAREREGKDWFTYEYWREKGLPEEQIEFQINGRQVTIYNWNRDKHFTDEHIERARRVIQELSARFPKILDQIRWVLVDDRAMASAFGDPEKYPLNGFAMPQWQAFRLLPRGIELLPHRIAKTTNFEGTFVHEATHLIDSDFEPEWGEKFKWGWCDDNVAEWEARPTSDGASQRFFNKVTGEMSPQGQFPLQPDQCVTYYAKQNMGEDICDSMVAYIYDQDLLKSISPDKYDILQIHDAKQIHPIIKVERIPKDKIRLPEIKPETVHYFIDEPAS